MTNTVTMQLYSLLIFTITGIAIGILFDTFRILRKSFKTTDFMTYIEDILFWFATGILFLFVLFKFNNGEIRSYVVIGLLIGLLMYMLLISKYFIKINITIICLVKKILIYPIRLIFKLCVKMLKPFSFVVINIKKSFSNLANKILNLTKRTKKL